MHGAGPSDEPDVADVAPRLAELAEPIGLELLAELAAALGPGHVTAEAALRLGTAFRGRYPGTLVAEALTLLELRDRAAGKFSRAARMWFTRAGLEQSSAEVVARHRAGRLAGYARIADLCCGIGGDLVALAARSDVLGVDLDPVHLWMARRNAAVHGVAERVTTLRADVRDADLRGVEAAFVDPARRSEHGRLRPGDSEPPLSWCLALGERLPLAVKAAPGIEHESVPPGWELEFVAHHRELKEATVWSPALAEAGAPAPPGSRRRTRATLLPAGHTLLPGPGDPPPVRPPGAFLLDPNPAVTRAGLVAELARETGTWQIDERIAFLSADSPVRTPFARTLQVIDSRPWDQKRLPRLLRDLDVGAVDIRRRGLAGNVDVLRRKLKPTGSRRVTLVMTRVGDAPWGLVCVDPS